MKKAQEFLENRKAGLIDELHATRDEIRDLENKLEALKIKEIDLTQNIESISKAIVHISNAMI